mmetsp:Transcript_26315/g.56526  ORF Transcript_26315/g.56526 Transcript_26315/m.56526 type:complete len:86 (+) Transcript_26315:198-455(+)
MPYFTTLKADFPEKRRLFEAIQDYSYDKNITHSSCPSGASFLLLFACLMKSETTEDDMIEEIYRMKKQQRSLIKPLKQKVRKLSK